MENDCKPNIARLWDAFNEHNREFRKVQQQSPGTWGSGFNFACTLFKQRLIDLGIADHFDWTEEDGSTD